MVWNHKWEQSYNPVFYFGKNYDTLFLNYCRPTWTKETLFISDFTETLNSKNIMLILKKYDCAIIIINSMLYYHEV